MDDGAKLPDAQLSLHGVVWSLYLTKSERGWVAVGFAASQPTVHSQMEDHDFRANALGDLVAAIYQTTTPGADNDDHEHDGREPFEGG